MIFCDSMRDAAGQVVDQLVEAVGAVRAVVVSSEDGFELVSRAPDKSHVSRLSAMASSMTALGAMAGEECEIGGFRSITLEAEDGFILMLLAQHPDGNLILSVIAESKAVIGQVLLYSKRAVMQLQQV